MANKPLYFSGKGKLKVGLIDANGNVAGYRFVGNVPKLTLTPRSESYEHTESYTGLNLTDIRLNHSPKLDVAFTLESFDLENLALVTWGSVESLAAAAFTDRALPAGVVVGLDYVFGTPGSTITAIKDSAATPATVDSSKYTVNADGTVTFSDVTSLVQPLKVDGNDGAVDYTNFMSEIGREISLIFEGVNTLNSNKPLTVKLPRVAIAPTAGLDLIGQLEAMSLEVQGSVLYDPQNPGTGLLAGYGSIAFQAAA